MVIAKINDTDNVSQLEDIKQLINECGAEAINKILDKKGTSVYIAEKPFEIFKYLHESKIHTRILTPGRNPFAHSCVEVINYLLSKGFDINYENDFTDNALFYSDEKRALYLIEKGININAQNMSCQNTLFHFQSVQMLEKLVNEGLDINHIDAYDENALFYCKAPGKINFLIKKGIDTSLRSTEGINFVYNFYENNIKATADIIKTGLKEKIDLLEEYSEKEDKNLLFLLQDINLLKKYQTFFMPIVNSINKNHENALFTSKSLKKTEILIEMGININHKNYAGETVLFRKNITLPEVKLLVTAGIDINAKNERGDNALSVISNIHTKAFLINAGIDYSKERDECMNNKLLRNAIMCIEINKEKAILNEFADNTIEQKPKTQRL